MTLSLVRLFRHRYISDLFISFKRLLCSTDKIILGSLKLYDEMGLFNINIFTLCNRLLVDSILTKFLFFIIIYRQTSSVLFGLWRSFCTRAGHARMAVNWPYSYCGTDTNSRRCRLGSHSGRPRQLTFFLNQG